MKNTKKWLALMLAGALTLGALTSCGSKEKGKDGKTTESGAGETENSVPLSDELKNLSPAQVYAAILEADNVKITLEYCISEEDGVSEWTSVMRRNGNKVSSVYDNGTPSYYDLDNGRYYSYNDDDGKWEVFARWIYRWKYLVFPQNLVIWDDQLLFVDDCYAKEGNRYTATADAIDRYINDVWDSRYDNRDYSDLVAATKVEVYMEEEADRYVYVFNTEGFEDYNIQNCKMTVEFGCAKVEYPEFNAEIDQDEAGLVYALNEDDTYSVISIGGADSTEITVPATYKGKPVTRIERGALSESDGYYNDSFITKVTLPDSITSIGTYAFNQCKALTEVNIPNGVTEIGDGAFGYCTSLTKVNISDGVASIGVQAFYFCTSLSELHIPASVTSISSSAFVGCSALERFTVDSANTVYHIDGNCLIETQSKTLLNTFGAFEIPQDGSIEIIGPEAFCYNTHITSIAIPDGVTYIGVLMFSDCSALTEVTIPDSVTKIAPWAFENCTSLKSVTFENPDGWTVNGEAIDLSDPAQAAKYLTETYMKNNFYRS